MLVEVLLPELLVTCGRLYGTSELTCKLVIGSMLDELIPGELDVLEAEELADVVELPTMLVLELVMACEGPYGPIGVMSEETAGRLTEEDEVLSLLVACGYW